MATHPRVISLATAQPPHSYNQDAVLNTARERLLDSGWRTVGDERIQQIERLFAASQVEHRNFAVDLFSFYERPRTTGERMDEYQDAAYRLGRTALEACLERAALQRAASEITDLVVVSCTGYSAPGLDILLARDLGLPRDIRRVCVGHMGCYGAMVGLRQCLDIVHARPGATAALLSVELSSLHLTPSLDLEVLTSFALFGDAAAAALVSDSDSATGPELVDSYCAADFAAADQMSWRITDAGFLMGLSPRIPVTLRRNVTGITDHLLSANGLEKRDVAHWLVHPGGPAILEAIQGKLELSEEQMALSWQVLREHGNCSSATVLLILDELLRSGRAQPGEWGVMMAFGPGLTLETCLLRF